MKAVVTGGSKGLGLTICKHLAKEGWEVVIGSRNEKQLSEVQKELRHENIIVEYKKLDVQSEESIKEFFNNIEAPIHLLVNNAGKNLSQALLMRDGDVLIPHPTKDWINTLNLCLTGVFLCGREAAMIMAKQKDPGCIVNISSTTSKGAAGQSAYTAAKAGVEALTKTWSLELAKYGIRVAAVAPGVIKGQALDTKTKLFPNHKRYMDMLKEKVPLRRWATEEEIAKTVSFIAENKYITGTVIKVDGGGLPNKL